MRDALWQDLKYGARMLVRQPGFTLVAVLTLALGIGANTAIFSVVNAVLLRPLPYPEPNRLVFLWSTFIAQGVPRAGSAMPDYREWRDRSVSFEGLASFYYVDFNLTGAGQEPERVQGARVTPNFLDVLGVAPARGRNFRSEEEHYGEHHVALLSHALWQRRYGGDPNIVGKTITVGGESHTVVGVLPEGLPFMDNVPPVELLAPVSFEPGDNMDSRNNHFVYVIGRLKPGVSLAQAQADVTATAQHLKEQFPENAGLGVELVPASRQLTGDSRLSLLLLLGAVGFVLLVSCVNVANLLLARSASRERELAIRAGLGATRLRLVRQLLAESAPLALLGGVAGLLLALWSIDALVAVLPLQLPRFNPVTIDATVFLFALGVAGVTVLLFGVTPAWYASRTDVVEGLNEAGRTATGGRRRHRLLGGLVAVEMALALVLLVGAGLMLQSLYRLQRVDAGFSAQNVLTMSIPLPGARYPTEPEALAFFTHLLERISALPGVKTAGLTTQLPLGSGAGWGKFFSVADQPPPASLSEVPLVRFMLVSEDYFRAVGASVRQGRGFTREDTTDAQQVAVINETLARRFFPHQDPLGKSIRMSPPKGLETPPPPGTPPAPFRTIVGVIADIKDDDGLAAPPDSTVYAPYYQYRGEGWFNNMQLAVRTESAPEAMTAGVLAQVRTLDPDLPVTQIASLEDVVRDSLSRSRFSTLLLGLFAGLGVFLAAIGIYGVMAFSVAERTHEFGIRLALGARAFDVFRLVLGRGLYLALAGTVLGVITAAALTRLLSSQLYGVAATDPFTFAAVSLLLVGVALVACWIPARRATRVDPMVALRYE